MRLRLAHLDDAGLAAFCAAEGLASDAAGVYVRVAALNARTGAMSERTPWEGPLHASSAAVQSEEPTRLISRVMARATRGTDGENIGVNEDTILQLEVKARSLPDVNLLDLPGVVGGSVDGEPDDMAERTSRLVEKHLAAADTLVLVVVEATAASVRNSLAFSLVKAAGKVDKAVGVLTKADGCTGPSLSRLKMRLQGLAKDVPLLGYGYLTVVNRDSCDGRNLSIATAAAEEADWIARNLPAELHADNGGDALVQRLATMLTGYVRDTWAGRALRLLRSARSERRFAILQLGEEVASNAAARAATLLAVLEPLPALLATVGEPKHWNAISDKLRLQVGNLQSLLDAEWPTGRAQGTPNWVNTAAYRASALGALETRAIAAVDEIISVQKTADCWDGVLLSKLSFIMFRNSGTLPLRRKRFVYLHEQVLLLVASFLTEQRDALHGRVRALLHRFSDVCVAAWDGCSTPPLAGLDSHLARITDALWRGINIDLLTLVSSILLLDTGSLSSAAALNAALLARPENGLAALLAEDATTAAQRAGLKRAVVDLRTAIVAIAGLHEPPCLLPEDEEEPELPMSWRGPPR